jgi:Ca-activated chloride channel homolog
MNLDLTRPEYLWLFLVFVPMLAWYIWKTKRNSAKYQISNLEAFKNSGKPFIFYLRHILFLLRLTVLALLIIALARPKTIVGGGSSGIEGISIALSIDISSSMLAQDFKPDRLEVAKDEAINFISGRPDDRIAVVAFAGESFTQCPLTTDHASAINLLRQLKTGIIEDGTAIGLGLANAIARLKEDDAKSKVVILLTDGVNNKGEIAPLTAAEVAAALGIRVYTIGIGNNGYASYPIQTPGGGVVYQQMEVQIDENLLQNIAKKTGGQYFRATDGEKLAEIYEEIDKLEKTMFEKDQEVRYQDHFMPFLIFAIIFLVIEILLRNTVFNTKP